MTTKAWYKFHKTIKRCKDLNVSYMALHELALDDPAIRTPKDIVRAAVVLAVAALDAYVTDVFSEKLIPYLKKYEPGKALVQLLANAGLDTAAALHLITMERPYRRIRTMIDRHCAAHTTHRFQVIDDLFAHYCLPNITRHAEAMSGRKTLRRSVEILVDRRHSIAHSGDYNAHDNIRPIDELAVQRRINDLEALVNNMDIILCNRI